MRIAIFFSKEHVFTYNMLKELFERLRSDGHVVVGTVFLPDKLGKDTGIKIPLAYFKIFGLKVLAKLIFRSLLSMSATGSFGKLCDKYGIRKIKSNDPNSVFLINWIVDESVDIILNFVGHILKKDIVQAPKLCILNKHSSLIPAYKGILPVFWAIKNNDLVGVSIHKVCDEIDSGEVISQRAYTSSMLRPGKSVYDYYAIIFKDTPKLISESIKLLENGARNIYEQVLQPSYFGLPTRHDYIDFVRGGHRFI